MLRKKPIYILLRHEEQELLVRLLKAHENKTREELRRVLDVKEGKRPKEWAWGVPGLHGKWAAEITRLEPGFSCALAEARWLRTVIEQGH